MGTRKVILEVRINEYAGRERNPHVPWSPKEIAEEAARCREAGASILHYHAQDPSNGAPSNEASVYCETARRVRESCDLVLNPTLGAYTIPDPVDRVAHIPIMAADETTRPDLAPVDLASANVDPYVPGKGFAMEDVVFMNPIADVRKQIEVLRGVSVRPEVALYTIGAARVLGAFLEEGQLDEPILAEIVLSDLILAMNPATPRGLLAMLDFLPAGRRIEWVAFNAGGNSLPLVAEAVRLGGHVALGLGDYGYPELGVPTNADVIAEAARIVRLCGAEVATPDEARELLELRSP